MTFDTIIKGGNILDGVQNDSYLADIGIVGDEIKAIGKLSSSSARKVIDAENKYVAPGFIDVQNHSDSYLTLIENSTLPSLVTQGVTTIVVGHCGASLGPLPNLDALRSVQKWGSIVGANLNWLNFEEYLQTLEDYPLGVNVASLVGHATLRRGLLKDEIRPATPEEITIEGKVLRESLDAGGVGLSMGLVYAHEVNADAKELEEVSKITAAKNRLLSVHLRSERGHVTSALDEVIGFARIAKVRVKISHFKIQGSENWKFFEAAIGAVDRAYQSGLDISFDVYPYTTSWSVLYTYLPKWAYEGGKTAILKNLKDRTARERMIVHLSANSNLGQILIATSANPAFIGKTLSQIAKNQDVSVAEALLNVIEGTSAQVVAFDHNLSPEIVEELLRHPLSMVASDGAGYPFNHFIDEGLVHPRCFGAFPKFLSMIREKKFLNWADAIKKITSRPAEKARIAKRGRLAPGYFADAVVFDPHTVGSKASYQNPYVLSDGINSVIVNGKIAWDNGQIARSGAGRILRIQ